LKNAEFIDYWGEYSIRNKNFDWLKVRQDLKKFGDINNQTREKLKGAPPIRLISKKVFSRLVKEILFQKGLNWSKKYRNNPSWIYPRLEVILLKNT